MDKRAYSTRKMRFPKQKPRGKSPTRLLVLLIALLILFYLIGLLGRSFSGGSTNALEEYTDKATKIIEKSNQVAKGFEALKGDVGGISRDELKSRLAEYEKSSKEVLDDCNELEAPNELEQAHTYLILCMELRAEGLETYRPALFNALKDIDLEVASGQISLSLKDIALSDKAYLRFSSDLKKVLKEKGVKKTVPESKFLSDNSVYEKTTIIKYVQELKGAKGLEVIHGIGVSDLITDPKQIKVITAKKIAVLPSADSISVTVTVGNQGNQIETNVPVVATIKSVTEPKEQKKEAYLETISPGQKKSITISGLKPTQDPDVTNLLTITAGPVPNEKFTGNNVIEYKFIMT